MGHFQGNFDKVFRERLTTKFGMSRLGTSSNYPDSKTGYQEVFFSLSRKLRPGLDLGVQYRFDGYKLDDFYFNPLQAYSQGLVTAPGLVINLQRQLLLNARFTSYHAHQESFFLKYSF